MTAKKEFVVQNLGDERPEVAGERRSVGETIKLTEKEAEFELSRGTIMSVEDHEASVRANPPAAGQEEAGVNKVAEFNSPLPEEVEGNGPVGGVPGAIPDGADEPEAEAPTKRRGR